jgi:hypothetical protein
MTQHNDQIRKDSSLQASRKRPRFCHLCGEKIRGSYLVYENGLTVCERCERDTPHCSQCGIPSKQLTQARGVWICPVCRQRAQVCACCHEVILGQYFIIGDSPLPYCEVCTQTRPRCDICRVPLDEQGRSYAGREGPIYRCASCLSSAVTTLARAEHLYRETRALLARELGLQVAVLPKLHLVERAMLSELHHQKGGPSINRGPTSGPDAPLGPEHQHLLGYFQRFDNDWNIYIEHLLPQTLFQAVAAHELAHAWQSTYAPQEQSLKVVEGFAEWVAYRALLALGQQREAARLTRRSDLYGDGLQYFIALERQHGRSAVMQRASEL